MYVMRQCLPADGGNHEVITDMYSRVFVDVAVTSSRRRKRHVCYDPQTGEIFEVDTLTKLNNYFEVYLDSLPARIYGEVLDLLEKNCKVFLLRDTNLVKSLRLQNNLEKSDRNDAYVLSLIPKELFRELSFKDLLLRRLISHYMMVDREIVRLKHKMGDEDEVIRKCIKDLIKAYEKEKERIGKEICEAIKNDRFYKVVLDYYGYQRSALIAMLLLKIDFSRGIHKILSYLGLHARAKNHNHDMRTMLSRVANNLYIKALKSRKSSIPVKYIEIARNYPKGKALLRIQVEIIKDIRRIWKEIRDQEHNAKQGGSRLPDERQNRKDRLGHKARDSLPKWAGPQGL